MTVPNPYPILHIDDPLHSSKQTRFMTIVNLKAGYRQRSIKRQDQKKTVVVTLFGVN